MSTHSSWFIYTGHFIGCFLGDRWQASEWRRPLLPIGFVIGCISSMVAIQERTLSLGTLNKILGSAVIGPYQGIRLPLSQWWWEGSWANIDWFRSFRIYLQNWRWSCPDWGYDWWEEASRCGTEAVTTSRWWSSVLEAAYKVRRFLVS